MIIPNSVWRIAVSTVSIGLVLLLLNGACSRDEDSLPTLQSPKVVKPIVRAPVSTEKDVPPNKRTLNPKSEEKMVEETRPAAVEEKGLETPEIAATVAPSKEETGYYVAKKGDTLAGIAGREDVYGDPLKWPIIGRHNVNRLSYMSAGEDLPDRALPEGMKLRVLTPDEVKENLEKRAKMRWAVNALSSPSKAEVIPAVVRLIREGFPVYITRARVKGKDYMRVRIGFFKDKASADTEGKKIMDVLNLSDTWTFTVGEQEIQAFGGY
jgi:hypothetical protein